MKRLLAVAFLLPVVALAGVHPNTLTQFRPETLPGCVARYQPHSPLNVLNGSGISQLTDLTGLGHHLLQATAASQPLLSTVADGLNGHRVAVFDGVDDFMKTLTFPLVQPTTVIAVIRQDVWEKDHALFDGFTDGTAQIYGQGSSPTLTLYAGLNGPSLTDFSVGQWSVATILLNGASSSLTKNQLTPVTGNAGTASMNGVTLGAGGANVGNFPISAVDLLIFNRVLSADERSYIVNGLAREYGINVW